VITYQCNEGFVITGGSVSRTCNSNGVWDGYPPACTGKNKYRFVHIEIGDHHCLNLSFYNQVKKWKTNVVYIVVPPTDMKRKLINSDYPGADPGGAHPARAPLKLEKI